MKVLIQDGQNKKFFTSDREWSNSAQAGQDFESHRQAYAAAQQSTAAEFNIVLYSPEGHYCFKIDQGKVGVGK